MEHFCRTQHDERRKAIFLDKDGTLVRNIPLTTAASEIALLPKVRDGLRVLSRLDFIFVIVTNQPGIAEGRLAEADLKNCHTRLGELFNSCGILLAGFYHCPHSPAVIASDCTCRKPLPGLLTRAANDLSIDVAGSWMIGDILDDIEAGHRAGCRSILINNGNETEWQLSPHRLPDYTVSHMAEAAAIISAVENSKKHERSLRFVE